MKMRGEAGSELTRRQLLAGAGGVAAALSLPRLSNAADARIDIDGNRLIWRGAPLRLTGVAVGDPTYIRADRPYTDYQVIANDWRANCVRISVQPGLWRADREGSATALAKNIAAARSLGLFVIVDWHRIGFPGLYDPLVPAEWGLPRDVNIASIDETIAFWRYMAALYGSDPAILFEIWNEPSADAYLWEATGRHWPLFRAAWEDIITAIREHADTIVLCAGGYWAHDLVGVKDDLVSDPRTAYAWHAYPNAERGDMAARLATLGGLQEKKPIVVTEWGFAPQLKGELHGTIADFGRPLVEEIFDRYGLSHTAWCYSPGAMPNLLANHEGAPSKSGSFVRDVLRRTAESRQWQRATRV